MKQIYRKPQVWIIVLLIAIPSIVILFSAISNSTKKQSPLISQSGPGKCLVLEEKYCNLGTPVYLGGNFVGVGFNIPRGTIVYSASKGTEQELSYYYKTNYSALSVTDSVGTKTITVFNPESIKPKNLPQTPIQGPVEKGKEIGRLISQNLSSIGNYNLLVILTKSTTSAVIADKDLTLKNFGL